MVRVRGPTLSTGATGSVGQALTFSRWKGKAYVKRKGAPTGLPTLPQKGMRWILTFLAQQWPKLSASDRQTWSPLAAAAKTSPINEFTRYNIDRFNRLRGLTQIYPALEDDLACFAMPQYTWTPPGIHEAKFRLRSVTSQENWGAYIFYSPTAPCPYTPDNVLTIVEQIGDGTTYRRVRDIAPGLYRIAARPFSFHGTLGTDRQGPAVTVLDYP